MEHVLSPFVCMDIIILKDFMKELFVNYIIICSI